MLLALSPLTAVFAAALFMAGEALAEQTEAISYNGITFIFDQSYEYGRFANGDYWVAGPNGVTISEMAPAFDGEHHGWEVNPGSFQTQGFDHRMRGGGFDPDLVPELPYEAAPGESIVKTVSHDLGNDMPRPALERAVVLTVVAEPPAGGGEGLFRPPYFGEDKPAYEVAEMDLDLLPSVPSHGVNAPSLASIEQQFQHVWLDHRRGWTSRYIHPAEHMPDYGSGIARATGDAALRLMLDDPVEDKRQTAINFVQWGLDLYAMYEGGLTWAANGGHMQGRKLPLALAAVLLDHDGMRQAVSQPEHEAYPERYDADVFQEDSTVYYAEPAQRVLWGQPMEDQYWTRLWEGSGSRTARDPHGYIDGGEEPGGAYQYCCTSMTWKGTALALQLMPVLRDVWNYEPFLDYVDRWVNFGAWTQPDPHTMDNEYVGYNGGRFPEVHGANTNQGSWDSDFANAMWARHRPEAAVPMPHVEPYGATFTERITVTLDSPHLEGARLVYTLDGSLPGEDSQEYTDPIELNEMTILRVRAYKEGYAPSAANRALFFKE